MQQSTPKKHIVFGGMNSLQKIPITLLESHEDIVELAWLSAENNIEIGTAGGMTPPNNVLHTINANANGQ
jgi:hypothetical protein